MHEFRRHLVKSAIGDLYCELAYQQVGTSASYISLAEQLLEAEIDLLRQASRQYTKGYRRLLLSLIEVKIWSGRYHDANILLEELLRRYELLSEPDIVDRLGHVRALIAAATHLPIINRRHSQILEKALYWNRRYNPMEEDVFTCGVVYLYLCLAWHKLGNVDISRQYLGVAVPVLQNQKPQFLMRDWHVYFR